MQEAKLSFHNSKIPFFFLLKRALKVSKRASVTGAEEIPCLHSPSSPLLLALRPVSAHTIGLDNQGASAVCFKKVLRLQLNPCAPSFNSCHTATVLVCVDVLLVTELPCSFAGF